MHHRSSHQSVLGAQYNFLKHASHVIGSTVKHDIHAIGKEIVKDAPIVEKVVGVAGDVSALLSAPLAFVAPPLAPLIIAENALLQTAKKGLNTFNKTTRTVRDVQDFTK